MKILMGVIVLVSMYGCVYGEGHDPLMVPVSPKRDPQWDYKCTFDPYKPECSLHE